MNEITSAKLEALIEYVSDQMDEFESTSSREEYERLLSIQEKLQDMRFY